VLGIPQKPGVSLTAYDLAIQMFERIHNLMDAVGVPRAVDGESLAADQRVAFYVAHQEKNSGCPQVTLRH
jgi:hypothetical protein